VSPDEYLYSLLRTEAVDTRPNSPALQAQAFLMPAIREWGGDQLVSVHPSGSFAKGTPNRCGTDIDLFISLKPTVSETLKEIYRKLGDRLIELGYKPRQRNVSLRIKVDGVDVDLVPGKQQEDGGTDHSLYRRRADTWTKTNVATHIQTVKGAGRQGETRLLKMCGYRGSLHLVHISAVPQGQTRKIHLRQAAKLRRDCRIALIWHPKSAADRLGASTGVDSRYALVSGVPGHTWPNSPTDLRRFCPRTLGRTARVSDEI
jgi:predicted nucleotidyltransferase